MNSRRLMIIGAGRHALETYFLIKDLGMSQRIEAFIQETVEPNKKVLDIPVLARVDVVRNYALGEKPLLIGAIGSVHDNKSMIDRFVKDGFDFFNAISSTVNIDRQKRIGKGITVAKGTELTVNISIDDYSMINIGCTLSHDVEIGKYVNISPGVHLAGYAKIEDEVFMGTGANVIPRVTVGKGSYVAAGACVTKNVPPYTMVAGVPAKVKKMLPVQHE